MADADRERLIEILKLGSCPSPYLCDENCKYANLERCYEERTADLLLEHGLAGRLQKYCDSCGQALIWGDYETPDPDDYRSCGELKEGETE